MTIERTRIPSKRAALNQVAAHLIGWLNSADGLQEAAGVDEAHLTPAERGRVRWALEDIHHRLLKLTEEPAE